MAERVEDGSASFALDCWVVDKRKILNFLERCIQAAYRDDNALLGDLVARPVVP